MSKEIKVAFQGELGAYSHIACKALFTCKLQTRGLYIIYIYIYIYIYHFDI